MRLLHLIFFSLGLPLILQATVSDDPEILPKLQPILTNVTTCRLPSHESSSKQLTIIQMSAKSGKTLVLDGHNLSKGFSIIDNNSPQDGSTTILETVIIKNFNIDYNLIESISNILSYYRKTLNVLTIDCCSLKLPSQLSDLSLKVKKLKIINSDFGQDFLSHFETIDELSLCHSNLAIIDNPDAVYLNIKKLEVFNSDLSQNFLLFLNDHRKLEELIIKNCKLTFDSVQNVSFGIKKLEISYCSLPKCFNQFLYHFQLLEEFVFNNCILPSQNFGRTFSTNVKKLKIINCLHVQNMLNAILFHSKDTLEELTFDHFYFTSQFVLHNNFKLEKLHTARITYCALNEKILKKTLSLFPSSLQALELSHLCINSSVDNYQLYGEYLILDFSYLNVERFRHLKNLAVKENNISKFRFENFEDLEEFECDKLLNAYDLLKMFYTLIMPKTTECSNLSMPQLNSSHNLSIFELNLSRNLSKWKSLMEKYSYLLNAIYVSAELVTAKFNQLKQISESMKFIKEVCGKIYELENFYSYVYYDDVKDEFSKIFAEISKLQDLLPEECPKLSDKLKKLRNLKRINTGEYDFRDHLNYFAEKNIVVDDISSFTISHDDLPNIFKILSTFTNVFFNLRSFTADAINRIPLENEDKFKHFNNVTFTSFNNTYGIVFMNRILNYFLGIRTITVRLSIENITAEQVAESFNGVEAYDNIENVHFTNCSSDIFVAYEFIIQILKRVPNLKSLSFEYMKEDIVDMLFSRIQKEQLKFSSLQKIDTRLYDGSINLLLLFTQTFPIEELNIDSYKLPCSPNEVLNTFSSKTLRKLRITRAPTDNDIFLKKCFSDMVNLKELHFKYDPDLITLFENNSTIEKVAFENSWFNFEYSEMVFPILRTFKSLKCIYVEYYETSHSYVLAAFKKHFENREVELIFNSEPYYFQ